MRPTADVYKNCPKLILYHRGLISAKQLADSCLGKDLDGEFPARGFGGDRYLIKRKSCGEITVKRR